MKNLLFTIQEYLVRFLFGSSCAGCHHPGPALCENCLSSIPLSSTTEHPGIYGLYNYGHPLVSHAIWNLKYSHRGQEARLLAKKGRELLAEIISDELQSLEPQKIVFVPIPQYRSKTEKRGFNQSVLIAQWFAKDIPEAEVRDLLEKHKETLPQSHISDKTSRMRNISGAMRAKGEIDPKQIYIIIDDVTTTGATFLEAMRALKSSGAKHIICVALAHGYKNK